MKIDAKVKFNKKVAEGLDRDFVRVPVDIDYVSPYESDIYEWVGNELGEMFGRTFGDDEFTITNLEEIVEEINFDEFEDKVN